MTLKIDWLTDWLIVELTDTKLNPSVDPGTSGGPASTSYTMQLVIFYLHMGFTSVNLHLNDTPPSHKFENTTKHCKSTIDHFICASHNLALFNSCHVLYDLPSNTSDHCSLVAEIRSNVFCCPQQQKKRINIPCITGENFLRRKSQRGNSVTLPGISNKLCELNLPTSPANMKKFFESSLWKHCPKIYVILKFFTTHTALMQWCSEHLASRWKYKWFRCYEVKIEESKKAGHCQELNPGHLWLEPPVLCNWAMTAGWPSTLTILDHDLLHRWYWMSQLHTWQPLSICHQNSIKGLPENSCHQERTNVEWFAAVHIEVLWRHTCSIYDYSYVHKSSYHPDILISGQFREKSL